MKICNRCGLEKNETDFYKYTNANYKQICKDCENHSSCKYELYCCVVLCCDYTKKK
jgi:hypothetical protein